MSGKLTILLQGASSSGKSQLVCWHTTKQANADTRLTIEETHEFLEDFQGRRVLVEILDTGGHPNYVSLLEDWVSRANAQVLVINLEDRMSVEYLHQHQTILSSASVLSRIVVGNLPSGKQENRLVSKEAAMKSAAAFGSQVLYLETNTRTGEGVNEVFSSLMQSVYGSASKEVKIDTNTTTMSDKDTELLLLKTRQSELESKLTAQEKLFSSRLESLEGKLHDISAAYQKMQEQALAARLEALEARFNEARLMHQIGEMAVNKPLKAGSFLLS
jgi:GTPase SAR1 family protein